MENLLEWSRIQTGKISYQPEMLRIQRLADNMAALYEQNLKNKEINFVNSIKPDIFAFADKSMTETIFRNLISNAIKFTHPNGEIAVQTKVNKDSCEISVSDNGVGIAKENIKKNELRINFLADSVQAKFKTK